MKGQIMDLAMKNRHSLSGQTTFRIFSLTLILCWSIAVQAQLNERFQYHSYLAIDSNQRTAMDRFGTAMCANGSWMMVTRIGSSLYDRGIYVYKTDAMDPNQQVLKQVIEVDSLLTKNNHYFGNALAMNDSFLFVPTPGYYTNKDKIEVQTGRVFIYKLHPDEHWVLHQVIPYHGADKVFGFSGSVAADRTTLVLGASNSCYTANGSDSALSAGSVWVYELSEMGLWKLKGGITAPDRATYNLFGHDIAIYNEVIAVSAPNNSYDTNNGSYLNSSGKIYLFEKDQANTWVCTKQITAPHRRQFGQTGLVISLGPLGLVFCNNKNNPEKENIFNEYYLYEHWGSGETKSLPVPKLDFRFFFLLDVTQDSSMILLSSLLSTTFEEDRDTAFPFDGLVLAYKNRNGSVQFHSAMRPQLRSNGHSYGSGLLKVGNTVFVSFPSSQLGNYLSAGMVLRYRIEDCEPAYVIIDTTVCDGFKLPTGIEFWNTSGLYTDTSFYFSMPPKIYEINLTVNYSSTRRIDTTICGSYLSPSGNLRLQNSGTYFDTLINAVGCDSIIQINIQSLNPDAAFDLINGYLVAANPNYPIYRWMDCFTGEYVYESNFHSFQPKKAGLYALEVNNGFCTNTSACIPVKDEDILNFNPWDTEYEIFPNPSQGTVNIAFRDEQSTISVKVYNINGQIMQTFESDKLRSVKLELPFESGIYFLVISRPGELDMIYKIIKL